jgi:hypothetical protein
MQVRFFRSGNSRVLKVSGKLIHEALGEMPAPVLHMLIANHLIMLQRFKFDLPLEEQHEMVCGTLLLQVDEAQSEVIALSRQGDLEVKKVKLKESGTNDDDLVFYAFGDNPRFPFLAFYFCKASAFIPEILIKAFREEVQ